ncbi:MAG TPA: transcriptional regulator NrdR [Bdellovibrionota bacterium]|nr:transcriptional regulator NrdR [Bdellovibrionota bacterium]
MICPFCTAPETKVIDSRLNQPGDIVRRRRECVRCDGRFTTYERVEEVMPLILKKDGRREPYLREKLFGGIQKACQKLEVTTQAIETLVHRIEKKVQGFGLKEMPSRTLGTLVMAELHRLNTVAYVRFSSVYREFRDVEEFVAELQDSDFLKTDPTALTFPFLEPEAGGPK